MHRAMWTARAMRLAPQAHGSRLRVHSSLWSVVHILSQRCLLSVTVCSSPFVLLVIGHSRLGEVIKKRGSFQLAVQGPHCWGFFLRQCRTPGGQRQGAREARPLSRQPVSPHPPGGMSACHLLAALPCPNPEIPHGTKSWRVWREGNIFKLCQP